MNNNVIYLGIVASRRIPGIADTKVHTQVALTYGAEGPNVAEDRFVSRLLETYASNWVFDFMRLTEYEFNALERLDKVDA